jgi:hypothetical protein
MRDIYIFAAAFGIYTLYAIALYLWPESLDIAREHQHEHIEGDPL